MKTKKFLVKEEGISIPIYGFADGRFCVDAVLGAKRKRITRTSLEEAKIEARKLIAQIVSGRSTDELLTRAQVDDYRLAMAKLEKYQVSLLTVVDDWIALHQRAKSLVQKNVPDLVEEFLAEKELGGASSLHVADRKSRLRKFAEAFTGRIDRVTTSEIKTWLMDLKCSRRTQRNYRDAVLQLFRFARSRGCLPKNEPTAVDEIEISNNQEGEIHIYTVAEMRLLLTHATETLLPFFCLGAFAGLRSQEIMRLEWEDVRFEQGFIEVSAAKSKTASRRLVPLLPAAREWLFPLRKTSGRVMAYAHNAGLIRARIHFCTSGIKINEKVVAFDWKPNALRHSYASYRLADVKDAARVALEMGNSPSMLFRNYRELVLEKDAKEWFALLPSRATASAALGLMTAA